MRRHSASGPGESWFGPKSGNLVAGGVSANSIGDQSFVHVFLDSAPFNGANLVQRTFGIPFEGTRSASCDRYRQDNSCFRSQDALDGFMVSPIFGDGVHGAVTALGDAMVVSVNFSREHVTYGPPRACGPFENPRFHEVGKDLFCATRFQADTNDHVKFYLFRRSDGAFLPLTSPSLTAIPAGTGVNWIELSESGREMEMSNSAIAQPAVGPATCESEAMRWIPFGSTGFDGEGVVRSHPGQPSGCENYYFGAGTFAPLRAPNKSPARTGGARA